MQSIYKKPIGNIICNCEIRNAFPLRLRTRQLKLSILNNSFNIVPDVLASAIKERSASKSERKFKTVFIHRGHNVLYNPKKFRKKKTQQIQLS
jgi:hypothetical protein